ncbi:MAG: DUF4132 domain-containing protein [Blastocatellia bacterium]|nr:DUF4132 domain-containing protein [Blastocatellia bacterium]
MPPVELRNPCGLSEYAVSSMEQTFYRLNQFQPGLGERLLRYVVDGDDEMVLAQLPPSPAINPHSLPFAILYPGTHANFWNHLNNLDVTVFSRLVRVFSTFSKLLNSHQTQFIRFGETDWLSPLLNFVFQADYWKDPVVGLSADIVEQAFVEAGNPPETLIRAALWESSANYYDNQILENLPRIAGFREYCLRHGAVFKEALQGDSARQAFAIKYLLKWGIQLDSFLPEITLLVGHTSKATREAVIGILAKTPEPSEALLLPLLQSRKASLRANVVQALWQIKGSESFPLLVKLKETETTASVLQAIEEVFRTAEVLHKAQDEYTLPPVPDVAPVAPLSPAVFQSFRQFVKTYNANVTAFYEKMKATAPQWLQPIELIDEAKLEDCFKRLQEAKVEECLDQESRKKGNQGTGLLLKTLRFGGETERAFLQFLAHPEIQPVHVLRFLALLGLIMPHTNNPFNWLAIRLFGQIENFFPQKYNLREMAKQLEAVGVPPEHFIDLVLSTWGWTTMQLSDAHKDKIWPYFAEHPKKLIEVLAPQKRQTARSSYEVKFAREGVFRILKLFPLPPQEIQPSLWEIALGETKNERVDAQYCLRNVPGKVKRIEEALKNRSATIRSVAAKWLADLEAKSSVGVLKAALKAEKNDVAWGALLTALERLGEPLDEYLNRETLLAEAQAGLKKGIPKELGWFPFDLLPPVHWEDTGKPVNPDILRWFVIQSYKLKLPEAGPILRRYVGMMRRADRETFGSYVFASWLGRDLTPLHTRAEAEQITRQAMLPWTTNPHWQNRPEELEKAFQRMLQDNLQKFIGAAGEKGLLAIPSACCEGEIVPQVAKYLKDWGGTRASQSKSLLAMLAWIDDPLAVQLLLAVGNRFKTKSIQTEANRLAAMIAERNQWTVDEMADRTIPSLGFDEKGILQLDYGERTFFVTLDREFTPVLKNQAGEVLKSLPEPRKTDNEELVTEAKQTFRDLKPQLKTTLGLQRDRLYEAMCVRRRWKFSDWHMFLLPHPIVGRMVSRLIWSVIEEEKHQFSFRPLEDGSLTDATDNEVTVGPNAWVEIAHAALLPPAETGLWQQHCSDYEVDLLFHQVDREPFRLPESQRDETELKDFLGYLIEAFKLRGKVNALGYNRGQAEDGGWFFQYLKPFGGLKLEAVIEFTGNGLPEENRTVALQSIVFRKLPDETQKNYYFNPARVKLGEVPPVLLCEVWNDVRSIAAQGTGFDPDWEKKTYF